MLSVPHGYTFSILDGWPNKDYTGEPNTAAELLVLFYIGMNQDFELFPFLYTRSVLECVILTSLDISMLLALLLPLSSLHKRLDSTQHCVDGGLQLSRELSTEGRLLICGGNENYDVLFSS